MKATKEKKPLGASTPERQTAKQTQKQITPTAPSDAIAVALPMKTPTHREAERLFLGQPEPVGPQLDNILWFHRRNESYVPFLVKDGPDGQVKPVRSIRVSELYRIFPSIAERLIADSYFGINGSWLPHKRSSDSLTALNAVWCDFDCHKAGISRSDAFAKILEAASEEVIPFPSLLSSSGQGVWAFWMLGTPGAPDYPPDAKSANVRLLTRINAAIVETFQLRFPELCPDPAATDAARITRVPGSLNSKAGGVFVQYLPFHLPVLNSSGERRTYTLEYLAEFFSFGQSVGSYREIPTADRFGQPKTKRRRGKNTGFARTVTARLTEFRSIWWYRGGFKEGHRNDAALIYACHLLLTTVNEAEIRNCMKEFAESCTGPLSRQQRDSALAAAKQTNYRWKNRTIAERLGVTVKEADKLGLRQIRPDFTPKPRSRKGRREDKIKRELTLKRLVRSYDERGLRLPSVNDLCTELAGLGAPGSPETVRLLLRAIGREPEGKAGRKAGRKAGSSLGVPVNLPTSSHIRERVVSELPREILDIN